MAQYWNTKTCFEPFIAAVALDGIEIDQQCRVGTLSQPLTAALILCTGHFYRF